MINIIQQGMAREMNFRVIVELVGDKLREVFASNDISIHGADLKTLKAQALYVVERGQRLSLPDYRMDPTQPVVQQSLRGEAVLAHTLRAFLGCPSPSGQRRDGSSAGRAFPPLTAP